MSSAYSAFDASDHDGSNSKRCSPGSRSRRVGFLFASFSIGVVLTVMVVLIINASHHSHDDVNPTPSPNPIPPYNPSDFISNAVYYQQLNQSKVFDQHDNLRVDRLDDFVLCPCSHRLAFTRQQFRIPSSNESATTLHLLHLPIANPDGSDPPYDEAMQLTQPIYGVHDSNPTFTADKQAILFLSNRGTGNGLNQIFRLTLSDDRDENGFYPVTQLTNFPIGVDNLKLSPSGDRIAFSVVVYSNMSMEETVAYDNARQAEGVNVMEFDKLMIRHWDHYFRCIPFTGICKRNHVFLSAFSPSDHTLIGSPVDILLTIDSDSPTLPYGDRGQWDWSASGKYFAYTRQHDETSAVAWTTNLDIFNVTTDVDEGKGQILINKTETIAVTADNLATDTEPNFHPFDDEIFVYRSTFVSGYESAQYFIRLYNRSQITTIYSNNLYSVQSVKFSADGNSVYYTANVNGNTNLFEYDLFAKVNQIIVTNGSVGAVAIGKDQQTLIYSWSSMVQPTQFYKYNLTQSLFFNRPIAPLRPLTDYNSVLLSKVRFGAYESFQFTSTDGSSIQAFFIYPVDWDPQSSRRHAVANLIHGGPQDPWLDGWSFRWHYQNWASASYAVLLINFHGSDGYGQAFTDSIQGNYGSLPFFDIVNGTKFLLDQSHWKDKLDRSRVVALGASYGGYMINWLAGQNTGLFAAFVTHDGMSDIRAFYYTTEELWFPEHDQPGTPFWNGTNYERYNPVDYFSNWKTPHLIIHGGIDYRIEVGQGIACFTTLQRLGVPSHMVIFPNEDHWVLKPLNSLRWYQVVFDWINKYAQPQL